MQHFSPSAERNKIPILTQLTQWLKGDETVLEIGSGSGQHGLFFASHFPVICWQSSDRQDYLPPLADNIRSAGQMNVLPPIELDVMNYDWRTTQYDVVYTANTLHIMRQVEVDYFFSHVDQALHPQGRLIVYGPFNYHGAYTSNSNRDFDVMLRQRNVGSCIKSFETINKTLSDNHFTLQDDVAMPANNRLIVWQYRANS